MLRFLVKRSMFPIHLLCLVHNHHYHNKQNNQLHKHESIGNQLKLASQLSRKFQFKGKQIHVNKDTKLGQVTSKLKNSHSLNQSIKALLEYGHR